MATTPTYSIELPDPGQDADTWGVILNSAFASFEGLLNGTTPIVGAELANATITSNSLSASTSVTIRDADIEADTVTADILVLGGGVTEKIGTLTGAGPVVDPGNGTIQMYTMTVNSTISFSAGAFTSGKSVTLGISTGGFTLTWPSVQWIGGGIPVLETAGGSVNWVTIWNVAGVFYGIYSGAST